MSTAMYGNLVELGLQGSVLNSTDVSDNINNNLNVYTEVSRRRRRYRTSLETILECDLQQPEGESSTSFSSMNDSFYGGSSLSFLSNDSLSGVRTRSSRTFQENKYSSILLEYDMNGMKSTPPERIKLDKHTGVEMLYCTAKWANDEEDDAQNQTKMTETSKNLRKSQSSKYDEMSKEILSPTHNSLYPSSNINPSSSNVKPNVSVQNVTKEHNLPKEHETESPVEDEKMKAVSGEGTANTKYDEYIIDPQYFPSSSDLSDAHELISAEEEKQTSREDGILIQQKPSIVDIIKQHKSSSSVNNVEEDEEDSESESTLKENVHKRDVTSNKESDESSFEEQKRDKCHSNISEHKSSLYVSPEDKESHSQHVIKSHHITIPNSTEKETKTWCTRENASKYKRDGRETKSSKTLSEIDPVSSSYRHVGNAVKLKVAEKGDTLIQKNREIQSKHISSDIFPVSASTKMKWNVPQYNNQSLNLNNFKTVIDKSANLYSSLDKCPFETLSAEKLTDVINMVNDTISQLKGISDVNLNSILQLPLTKRLGENFTESHIKYDYGTVNIDKYDIRSKPLHVKRNPPLGKMGLTPSDVSLSTSTSSYDDSWGQNNGHLPSGLNFMDTIGAVPLPHYGETGPLEQHQFVNMLTNLYTLGPMSSVSTPLQSTTSGTRTCKVSTSAGLSSPNNTLPLLDVSNDIGDFISSSKKLPRKSEPKVRSRLKTQKSGSNSLEDPIMKDSAMLDSSITNQASSSTVNCRCIPVITKEAKQLRERLIQLKGSITDSKHHLEKCLEEERDRKLKEISNNKNKPNSNGKLPVENRRDANTYLDVDITSGIGAQIAALSRSVDASNPVLLAVSEGEKCTSISKCNKGRRKTPTNIAKEEVCTSSHESVNNIEVELAKDNTSTISQVDLDANLDAISTPETILSGNSRKKKVKSSRKITDFTSLNTEPTGIQPDSKHIADSSKNDVVTLDTNSDTLMDSHRKKRDSHCYGSSDYEKKQNSNDHFLKSPSHPENVQTSIDTEQKPKAKKKEKLKSTSQTNHKSATPNEEIRDKSAILHDRKSTSESVEDKESEKPEVNTSIFSCSLTSCGEGSRTDRSLSSESYNLSTKTEKKTKSSPKKKDKRQEHKSESAQVTKHLSPDYKVPAFPSEQKGSSRSCTSISSGKKTSSRSSKQRCRTPSSGKNQHIKPTEDGTVLTSLGENRVMTYSEIMSWVEKSLAHLDLEGKLQGDGKNVRNSRKRSHGRSRKQQKVRERTSSTGRKQRNKTKYKSNKKEIPPSTSPKEKCATCQDESLKSTSDNILEVPLENGSDIPLQDFLRDRMDTPLEDSLEEKREITLNDSLKERSEFTLSDSLKEKSDFTLSDSLKEKSDFTLSDSLKKKSETTLDASVKQKSDSLHRKQTTKSHSLDSESQQTSRESSREYKQQENITSNSSIGSLVENLILSATNTIEEIKSKDSANESEESVNVVGAKCSNTILRALFSRDRSQLNKTDNSKDNHRPSAKNLEKGSMSFPTDESPKQSEDNIHGIKKSKTYLSTSSSSGSASSKTLNAEIPWTNDQGTWTNNQSTSMISGCTNDTSASNVFTISSIVTSVFETIDDSTYHCEKTSDNRNTFISSNTQTGFLPEAYSKYVTKTSERIPKRETRNSERPFIADSRKVDAVLDMISDVYRNENKLFENRSVNSYVTCEREVYSSGTRTNVQGGTSPLHSFRTTSAGYKLRSDCRPNQEYSARDGSVGHGYSSDNYAKRNVSSLQTSGSPFSRQGRCNAFTSGRSRSYGSWSSDMNGTVEPFSQSQTNLARSQQTSQVQSARTASRWYLSNMPKEATTTATMPFSPAPKGCESRERTPPDEFCCTMDQVEDHITTTVTTISSDSISDADECNDWARWVMTETDISAALPASTPKKEKTGPSKGARSSCNNAKNEPSDCLKYKSYAKKSLRSYQYMSSTKSIRSSNPPVSRSVELGGVVFMGVGGERMSAKGIQCSSYVRTQMRPVQSPPVRDRNEKKFIRTRKVQTEECFHSKKRKPVTANAKGKSKAEPNLIVKSNRQPSSLVPIKDAEVASIPRSTSPSRKDESDEKKDKALTLEIEKTDHWNASKTVTVTRLEILESNILTSLSRNLTNNSQEKKPLPGNKPIPNKQIQKRPSLNVNRRLNTYRCEKRSAPFEALLSVLFKSISGNEVHRKPNITGSRSTSTAGRTVKPRTSKKRALRRGERKKHSASMSGIIKKSNSSRLSRTTCMSRADEKSNEEEHLKRNSPIPLGEPYDCPDPNEVSKPLDGQILPSSYPPLVINHNWDKSITESRVNPLNEQVMEHGSQCDRNFIKPMNSILSTPQETFADLQPVALTQEVKDNEYEKDDSKLMICKSVQTVEVQEVVGKADLPDCVYVSKEVQTSVADSEENRDDESTCNDEGISGFFSGKVTVESFAQGFKEQLQRLLSIRNDCESTEVQHILGDESASNVQNLSKSLVVKLKSLFSETSIVKSEFGSESELSSLPMLDDSESSGESDDLGDAGDSMPPLSDVTRNRSSIVSVNNLATIISSSLLSVAESNKVIPITDDKSNVVIDLNSRANVDKFHIVTRNMVNSKETDNFIEVKSSRSVTEIRIGVASLEQGTNSSNIVKLKVSNTSNTVTMSVEPREICTDAVSTTSDEGTVIIDLSLEKRFGYSKNVGTAIVCHSYVLRRAFEVDLAQEEFLMEYLEIDGLSNEEDNLACEYECSLWYGHSLLSMGDISSEYDTAVNEVASEDEITVHDLVSPGSLKCILSVLSHANSSREYSLLSPEAFEGEILNDSPKPDSMQDVMDAYSLLSSNSSLMNDIYSSDIISTPSYISESMETAQDEGIRNILHVMGREVTYGVSEIEIQVYNIKFPLVLSFVYLLYIAYEWNQVSVQEVVEEISCHEEEPIYPAESSVEQDLDGAGDGTSPLLAQTDNKHDFWASLNLEDLMRAGPAYHLQDRRDSSSLSVMVTQSVANHDNISISETCSGSASGSGSGSGSDFDCDYEALYNHLLAAYARRGDTDTDTTYSTIDTDPSREGLSKLLTAEETPDTPLHQAYSQIFSDVAQDQMSTENSTHRVFISAEGGIVSEIITQCLDIPVNNYPHLMHTNDSTLSVQNSAARFKSETSPRKRMIICLLCTLLFLVVFCALCLPDILYYDENANDNISLEEFIYDFSSDNFML